LTSLHRPELRNARDVGGLPTTDGRRIRERALIRTDDHVRLGPAGIDALRAHGVSEPEQCRRPSEVPGPRCMSRVP
jgi:protein tyrosine/serine phosphatase